MNKINKINPPQSFINRVEEIKEGNLSEPYKKIKSNVKSDLRNSLAKEQKYLCAYCEKSLIDKEASKEEGKLVLLLNENGKIPQTRIEHFKPQSIFNGTENEIAQSEFLCDNSVKIRSDLRIEYTNLLLCCSGSLVNNYDEDDSFFENEDEANSYEINHCDVKKKNYELCHIKNPAFWIDSDVENINFFTNFTIFSNNEGIDKEMNEKLNLNQGYLKRGRETAWIKVLRRIAKEIELEIKLEKRLKTEEIESKIRQKGGESLIPIISKITDEYKSGQNKYGETYYHSFRSCIIYLLEKRLRILSRKQ